LLPSFFFSLTNTTDLYCCFVCRLWWLIECLFVTDVFFLLFFCLYLSLVGQIVCISVQWMTTIWGYHTSLQTICSSHHYSFVVVSSSFLFECAYVGGVTCTLFYSHQWVSLYLSLFFFLNMNWRFLVRIHSLVFELFVFFISFDNSLMKNKHTKIISCWQSYEINRFSIELCYINQSSYIFYEERSMQLIWLII
jgi:hypothetical protein